MSSRRSFQLSGQVVLGIMAIFFGLLFLLDNMDVIDARPYVHFWPVFVILFGLGRAMHSSHPGGRFFGAAITLFGILLLIHTLGYSEIGLSEFWPILLILLGAGLVLGRTRHVRTAETGSTTKDSRDTVNAFALLSGIQQANNSQAFRGGEVTAILGGCDIDLRGAVIKNGERVEVTTFALWGAIKIRLPQNCNAQVKGFPIMGSFEDKSAKPSDANAAIVDITGSAIMGGVEVTN